MGNGRGKDGVDCCPYGLLNGEWGQLPWIEGGRAAMAGASVMARMIVSMVILGSNPSNGNEQRHGKHRCDPLHQRHFMPPQRTLTVGPWLGNSSRHGDTSRWLLRHPSEGEAAPDQTEDAGEKAAHADQ